MKQSDEVCLVGDHIIKYSLLVNLVITDLMSSKLQHDLVEFVRKIMTGYKIDDAFIQVQKVTGMCKSQSLNNFSLSINFFITL